MIRSICFPRRCVLLSPWESNPPGHPPCKHLRCSNANHLRRRRRHATRPAVLDGLLTWEYANIDLDKMHSAAKYLVGTHDFTSYRAVACQAKDPTRTVYELNLSQRNEFIFMDICANGFLHHMVRNIAGVLISIGKNEQHEDWALEVLESRDRTLGGITAPAAGLYLVKVQYDEKYGLNSKIRWPAITAI